MLFSQCETKKFSFFSFLWLFIFFFLFMWCSSTFLIFVLNRVLIQNFWISCLFLFKWIRAFRFPVMHFRDYIIRCLIFLFFSSLFSLFCLFCSILWFRRGTSVFGKHISKFNILFFSKKKRIQNTTLWWTHAQLNFLFNSMDAYNTMSV